MRVSFEGPDCGCVMKKILLGVLVMVALGACEVDEAFEQRTWEQPHGLVQGGATPSAGQEGSLESAACEQPHPDHCRPGYIRSIAPDVTTVMCQHIQGCASYSSNPCVTGTPLGDVRVLVLCE
jgi:hypothetical protein